MEKKISVTLPLETIHRIDNSAKSKGLNRQSLLKDILVSAASKLPQTEMANFELTTQYINDQLKYAKGLDFWEDIQKKIKQLTPGEETSLKKLVGKEIWLKIDDDTFKRMLGKVFKSNIDIRVSGLKIGRVKSNNEQQYVKM